MEYVRPSLEHVISLVVSDYELLVSSGWSQDVDLYIRRGGHFVIRLLQDCYAANGVRVPARGIDSMRYSNVGRASGKPIVRLPQGISLQGKRVLVVDDVADEADTLIAVREMIDEATLGRVEVKFMTLYKKPWAKLVPDFWAEETDRWINFPWEPFEILTDIMKRELPEDEKVQEVKKAGFTSTDLGLFLRVVSASRRDSKMRADVGEVVRRFG